jgi:hypothetical protein
MPDSLNLIHNQVKETAEFEKVKNAFLEYFQQSLFNVRSLADTVIQLND